MDAIFEEVNDMHIKDSKLFIMPETPNKNLPETQDNIMVDGKQEKGIINVQCVSTAFNPQRCHSVSSKVASI